MKNQFLLAFVIIFSFHCRVKKSYAQCDPAIRPIGNPVLKYKDRGNRCEGFYSQGVSSLKYFKLVQFTYGNLIYSPSMGEVLSLSIPTATETKVLVRATGLPLDLFYQMDKKLGANDTFKWPTYEVLLKHSGTMYARNIGVYGVDELGKNKYFPVLINSRNNTNSSSYVLKFISSTRISNIEWRLVNVMNSSKLLSNGLSFAKGEPIVIEIPETHTKGEYLLEVSWVPFGETEKANEIFKIQL